MTETRVERMNHEIAGTLLNEEITRLRTLSYAALANCIDKPTSTFVNGPDGKKYHIESQVFWDANKEGNIRVMVLVDDGGLTTAFKPLSGDFIISPDGSFI
jgi:hypothetical protein